jgi:hypothetical protein
MELTDELKSLLIDTAKQLKGSARRLFLARTVKPSALAVQAEPNANWAGIARPFAKGCTKSKAASRVWMRLYQLAFRVV